MSSIFKASTVVDVVDAVRTFFGFIVAERSSESLPQDPGAG
ncbi:hypothetical protein [Aeromicrobium yanjiei]|nr:hypothetical protein [Aeromicrobium yanjiei]